MKQEIQKCINLQVERYLRPDAADFPISRRQFPVSFSKDVVIANCAVCGLLRKRRQLTQIPKRIAVWLVLFALLLCLAFWDEFRDPATWWIVGGFPPILKNLNDPGRLLCIEENSGFVALCECFTGEIGGSYQCSVINNEYFSVQAAEIFDRSVICELLNRDRIKPAFVGGISEQAHIYIELLLPNVINDASSSVPSPYEWGADPKAMAHFAGHGI
jgi:hypothetical protein